jgi:hypothetical protein
LHLCSAQVAQSSLAAAEVRPTVFRNGLRDIMNCWVGIVVGCMRNGWVGATITADKPCEGGNRLVTHLGVGITGHNLNEVSYDIGDANILVTAPLASEPMEGPLADGHDGVAQSRAKDARRHIAGVMIQKEQAETAHRWTRMTEVTTSTAATGICLPRRTRRSSESTPHR